VSPVRDFLASGSISASAAPCTAKLRPRSDQAGHRYRLEAAIRRVHDTDTIIATLKKNGLHPLRGKPSRPRRLCTARNSTTVTRPDFPGSAVCAPGTEILYDVPKGPIRAEILGDDDERTH